MELPLEHNAMVAQRGRAEAGGAPAEAQRVAGFRVSTAAAGRSACQEPTSAGVFLWTGGVSAGGEQHRSGVARATALVTCQFSCLTTPHKLRPEARLRNYPGHRLVVCPLSKPTAEAVTLHAVVRRLTPM